MKNIHIFINHWFPIFFSIGHKCCYTCFFLFAFFLPIHTGASNLFYILSLASVIYFMLRDKSIGRVSPRWKMTFFTTLVFFVLYLIGIFNSDKLSDGYHFLERTIAFFLTPIVFLFFTKEWIQILRRALLKGIVVGSVISVLTLIVINLIHYFKGQNSLHLGSDIFNYYHTYLNFTSPLKQHPTYLGVYYLTAVLFLGEVIRHKKIKYSALILFSAAFLFLNSRVILLLLLALFGYHIFRRIRKYIVNRRFKKLWFVGLLSITALVLFVNLISDSYIFYRFKNVFLFEVSIEKEQNFNSHAKSNPRMARYVSALKLAKKKPLLGHGVSGEDIDLKKQFIEDELLYAAEQNYNAHNQYIGYAIRFGIIGVMALLFFIGTNAFFALRGKELSYFKFVLMIAAVNMVENFFDRNYGITFSAVFFTCFTYQILQKRYLK